MKAKFIRGDANRIGIQFEPETFEEQLLLEMFSRYSGEGYEFSFHGWEHHHSRLEPGGLTAVRGQFVKRDPLVHTVQPSAPSPRAWMPSSPPTVESPGQCPWVRPDPDPDEGYWHCKHAAGHGDQHETEFGAGRDERWHLPADLPAKP